MQNLPAKINEYIKNRFREGVIANVQTTQTSGGHSLYLVEVSDNSVSYHLRFDEKGRLHGRDVEANFSEDYDEGEFYGTDEQEVL